MSDVTSKDVQQAAAEIDDLVCTERTETQWRTVMDSLGCDYYPPGVGLSYAQWLRQVRDLLAGKQ